MDERLSVESENRAFFLSAVTKEMGGVLFRDVLYTAMQRPMTYGFEHDGYIGRMTVDATELMREDVFLSDISKAINRAALAIPNGISGDCGDSLTVVGGPYRFMFLITHYTVGDKIVHPMVAFISERMTRHVELKVRLQV